MDKQMIMEDKMKKELFMVTALLCAALLLAGCASEAPTRQPPVADQAPGTAPPSPVMEDEPVAATETPSDAESPDTLTPSIPRYALEEAEQYKAEFLTENSESAADLTYRFFYDENGDACLEYTVTPAGRYTWDTPTWIGNWWSGATGSIGNGEIQYQSTKRNRDEAEARIEVRRKDSAFVEIEKIVLQIATEYDYDFYGAYGKVVQYRVPTVKKAVCEGYADAVLQAFNNHPLVAQVETWSSAVGNHAWNVIVLKDGRQLYCDTTWYDGNNIDDEGYVIHVPARDPVNLTFDINEFNSQGGAINTTTGKTLAVHFGWVDAKK
jgi:hypothetical protein